MADKNPFLASPFDALINPKDEIATAPIPAPVEPPPAPAPLEAADAAVAPPPAVKAPSGSIAPPQAMRPLFEATASHFNVPVNVLMALSAQESGHNPLAVNKESGARGVAQYMDATAKSLGINPDDPNEAIPAMAKQLRERLDKGYSMDDAVKEHFAGPDRKLWGEKTAAYGREVLDKAGRLAAELYGDAGTEDASQATASGAPAGKVNANKFATSMSRADYIATLKATNPDASPELLKTAMDQFDAAEANRLKSGASRVQDKFAQMASPEATFNAKLAKKLGNGAKGVEPALPSMAQAPLSEDAVGKATVERPGVLKQSAGDLGRGIDNLKALGYGIAGLVADKNGNDEAANDYLNHYVAIQNDIAKNNPAVIGTYKNINSMGDAGRYAVEAVAENLPMLLPSMLSGGIGALAARKAATGLVIGMVESQVVKGVAREVAEKNAAQFVARAIMTGSAVGAAPSSIGMEAGSIMGDIYHDTGKKESTKALAYGIPAGLLDTLEPVLALRKIAGPVANEVAGSIFKRLGVEGGKQFIAEAGTEGLQTILEEAAKASASGKKLFTPELADNVIDSMLKGGIGGGMIGMGSGGIHEARGALANRGGTPAEREIAAEIDRQTRQVNFTGIDEAARVAMDPNNEAVDPRQTVKPRAPAEVAQPAEVPPAAPEQAAPAAAPQAFRADENGFAGQIMGDDGQMHAIDSNVGVIEPPAGPIESAINAGAEQHAADPAPPVKVPELAPEQVGPPPLEGLNMDELKARVDAVNQAAKDQGGATSATMDERRRIEKQIKVLADHAQATSKPAEEPIGMGPFDDRNAANKAMMRAAEATAVPHEVVEKSGKFTIKPIEGESDVQSGRSGSVDDGGRSGGNADQAGGADGKRSASDGPVSVERPADAGRSGAANAVDPAGASAPAVVADPLTDPHAKKSFGNESLARDYIRDNKLGKTHRVDQTGRAKFVVKPKTAAPKADWRAAEAKKAAKLEGQIKTANENAAKRAAAKVAQPAAPAQLAAVAGKPIDAEWTAFAKKSGTLNIDRAAMPQVKAEHRGALVNYLNARGVAHEQMEAPASSLKPTQREFSPAKVDKARNYEGGDRSILVSSDNHVLDGHHQWLAKLDANEPVKVIRLDAPIRDLLEQVKEFPSAEVADGATEAKQDAAPAVSSDVPEHERNPYAAYKFLDRELADNFMTRKAVDRAKFEAVQTAPGRVEIKPKAETGRKKAAVSAAEKSKPTPQDVPVAEETAPAAPIADFGQKLEGARKDLWSSYKQAMESTLPANAADITMSKHFPEPNYEALIADGADVKALAAVKAMRDEIPAKPRVPYKLRAWAEKITTVRELSARLLSGNLTMPTLMHMMRVVKAREMGKFADRIEMYADLGYPLFTKAADFKIEVGDYGMFESKQYSPPIRKYALERDGRTLGYFDSHEQAVDNLRTRLEDAQPVAKGGAVKLDLYRLTGSRDIIIGKKVAVGKYIDLKGGFVGVREAREYLASHQDELAALLEKKKDVRPERRSINSPRVGIDRRMGEDVTPEKFGQTFGFRGVQFGNYVEQKRRAADLNNAYDALMDLADLLRLPPQALSLNGTLGLAFGARGAGGKLASAAHFEPNNIVINLTKTNGAGSLAHEWFHGFDNYFERMRGADGAGHVTDRPEVRKIPTADRKLVDDERVRPELLAAVKGVMDAINASGLPKRSRDLDARRSKDYWSTTHELAARAFESYIIDKAADKNLSNDYLANILGEDAHKALDEMAGTSEPFPYPTRAEAPAINAAFDNLFDVVETRDDGGKSAMYSVARNKEVGELKKSLSVGDVGPVITRLIDSGAVVLHADASTLPGGKAPYGTQALTARDGTIHMVADSLSKRNARAVLLHEAFHQGGEKLIGTAEWKNLMARMGSLYRQSEQSSGAARAFYDRARARVATAKAKGAVAAGMEAEEFAAYAIEQYETARDTMPAAIRKWGEDMIGIVKAWFVKRFGRQIGQVTPAQLAAFAKMALMDVATARRGEMSGAMFSSGEARTVEVDGVRRPITNSKGQLVGQTFEAQQAFWKWFGDSKVVNEEGAPLTLYHGTYSDFDTFNRMTKESERRGLKLDTIGSWFTSSATSAAKYGSTVMPAYLSMKNPLTFYGDGKQGAVKQFRSAVEAEGGVEQFRAAAKDEGHDGIVIIGDNIDGLDGDVYISFEPEQIKSATGNAGTFDPANADIRYSVNADPELDPDALISMKPADPGLLRRFQAQVQDNLNRVKQIQDHIGKVAGIDDLAGADHYGAEANRPGRIAARLEDGRTNLTGPLMRRLAKSGHTIEQLGELLHAMHAKERNEAVAKINPLHDPASATYTGTQGSGMNDDEAERILEKYRRDGALHALADEARDITRSTLDLKLAYGLITAAQYEQLAISYDNYVPLKGDGEYGPKQKRAMGHTSREEFVMQNIARDYDLAVVAGEKNLARQSLLQLVMQFPDDQLWTARVPPKGRYVAGTTFNVTRNGQTEATFGSQAEVTAFMEMLGSAAGQYEVITSAGERVVEFTKQLQDNEVMLFVRGSPVRLQIHDEALAKQLRPLRPEGMQTVVNLARTHNRWLSMVYTGYNPAFILKNFARDTMTGTINMAGNEGAAVAARAWANYPQAWAAMLTFARTGKAPQGVTGEYLTAYRMNGGKVGASHMGDLEAHQATLGRMFDDAKGAIGYAKDGRVGKAALVGARKSIGALAHVVEVANQAFENALRLALFIALRKNGQTEAKAAQAAKQVTVNFDRKGAATGYLGAAYLFINPAIQGTANLTKTLVKGDHKGQAWGLIGAVMMAGAYAAMRGIDDDKDRWLGEKWETRTKNFRLHAGNHTVNIPLSQEYAPFYAAGVAMGEVKRGESPMRSTMRVMSSFFDAYYPINGAFNEDSDNHAKDAMLAHVPTVLKFPAQVAFNQSSFGGKVFPETDFTKGRPDNLKMYRGTKNSVYDKAAQGLADGAEKIGFAGKYENDLSKVSPETLKLAWRTYTGGLGAFTADVAGSAMMAAESTAQLETTDIPFIKDFIKTDSAGPLAGRYYDLTRDAQKAIDQFRQARKAGDAAFMRDMTPDQKQAVALGGMIKAVKAQTDNLADEAVDVNADPKLSSPEKRAQLKAIDAKKEAIYRRAIDALTGKQ